MRAPRAGNGIRAFNPGLPLSRNHAPRTGEAAGVLGIDVAPLIFGEGAVLGLEEVDRHLLASVEVQRPAIIPSDAVGVQISLVFDFHRRVVKNLPTGADAGVMLEFSFKRDGDVALVLVCHLDLPPFGCSETGKSIWL